MTLFREFSFNRAILAIQSLKAKIKSVIYLICYQYRIRFKCMSNRVSNNVLNKYYYHYLLLWSVGRSQ